MWLSQRKPIVHTRTAALGNATMEGDWNGVFLDGERRNLPVFAPGGYHWKPLLGQEVLVLNATDGACVTATHSTADLSPGEVTIAAALGGASILLKNDGTLHLNGTVMINGTPIDARGGDIHGAGS